MVRAQIELRPSEIRYTQDSIKNTFTFQHDGIPIGETLDDLCNGVCDVSDIPPISVFFHEGHYWSADNRRLWVLRQFERLGGCEKVLAKEINMNRMNFNKFTTDNDGVEVKVRGYRGDPGGTWHKRPDNFLRRQSQSSRHGRHGRKVYSFDMNTTPTVPLLPTSRRPPQPTTTIVMPPAPERSYNQAFGDPYSYGHVPSPGFVPARSGDIVSPLTHAHTPCVQLKPPYSPTGHSGTGSGRMTMARDTIIDIPDRSTALIPRERTHHPQGINLHKKSKKKSCCVIS